MGFDIQNLFSLNEMNDLVMRYSDGIKLTNLTISLLCGILLLLYIKTEKAKNRLSWKVPLGFFFILFFIQYLLQLIGIPELLSRIPLLKNESEFLFGELLGIPINICLLLATGIINNKKNIVPRWAVLIISVDVLAMILAVCLKFNTNSSIGWGSTVCKFAGDGLSSVFIFYFGLIAYKNTRFFAQKYFSDEEWKKSVSELVKTINFLVLKFSKNFDINSKRYFQRTQYCAEKVVTFVYIIRHYFETVLFIFVILYAVLHIVYPFIPLLAHSIVPNVPRQEAPYLDEKEVIIKFLMLSSVFLAIFLKATLFIFAFRISSIENDILIKLRVKLRESVDSRIMFFSREGIMKAIYEIFQVEKVFFYVKVPAKDDEDSVKDKLQKFEYSDEKEDAVSDYETIEIDETFINLQNPERSKILERNGIKAVKYHGGQIGYIKLVKSKKQEFTFSPLRMIDILSYDISPLMQFYRLQESVNVLIKHLKIIGEENIKNTEKKLESIFLSESENEKVNQDILNVKKLKDDLSEGIQKILSPESVELNADFMFVKRHKSDKEHKTEVSKKTYYNFAAGADVGFSIENLQIATDRFISGELTLQFKKNEDRLEKPSLGYYNTYGKIVSALVDETFSNCVEKKLELVIKQLSVELAGRQTFNSWFEKIDKYAGFALIDEVFVFYPQKQDYLEKSPSLKGLIKKDLERHSIKNEAVIKKLKNTQIPSVIVNTGEHLILGNKLKIEKKEAFIIFAVNTKHLPKDVELKDIRFNKKWENFFVNFADIAEKSLIRLIQAYEIEDRQKELSEFETTLKIGLFTHEILNILEDSTDPIFSLKEELNDLRIAPIEKEKLEKSVDSIKEKLKDLQNLASGIRGITNNQNDKGPASLYEAVKNVFDANRKSYDDRIEKIKFINYVGAKENNSEKRDDVTINLSLTYLELIFSNLIKNSLRAIKSLDEVEGSEIRVWTNEIDSSGEVICYISDTGCGIDYNNKDKIFDSTFSSKKTGGGLGLFSVRKILNRHNGRISLESSIKGNTIFKIILPKFKGENS